MAASDLSRLAASPNFEGFYIAGFILLWVAMANIDKWAGHYSNGGFATFYTQGYGTILVQSGTTEYCPSSYSVGTMSIFQSPPNGSPINILYMCAQNWAANTVFRQIQAATSTTSTSSSSSTSTTLATTTTSAAAPGGTTSAAPAATSTQPSRNTDVSAAASSSESSQAWIAGAVAGPVIGCALVGLLVWWIMRHRAKKASAAAAVTGAGGGHQNAPYSDLVYNDQPPPPHSRPVSSVPPAGAGAVAAWEDQSKATLRPVSTATYVSGPVPHEFANGPGTNGWQQVQHPSSPPPSSVAGSGGYGGRCCVPSVGAAAGAFEYSGDDGPSGGGL
ncbi:hypothetical protein PG997_015085 [Apiospora hydei]|uniref:Uncharacterized protein n=1 Tax=Apiospora hydei TaxID=1337664 RepID=A0ABR1UYW6_9PEZI